MGRPQALNPFIYDRPVQPEDLVDREREIEQLVELAEGGHNCRLTAPRRYGKTSLLRKVCLEVERAGMESVYVNFYGLLSTEEAVGRIERAYRDSLDGPVRNFVLGFMRTLQPRVTAPGSGVSVAFSPSDGDLGSRLASLLDLPRKIQQRHGRRTLVVFDEFQDVLATKPSLDGLIRSRIEQHGAEASYLFAGSHPAMMQALFGDRTRPFYGQARSLRLDGLPDGPLAEHVGNAFLATGRDAGDAVDLVLGTAAGHPQRAMMLAHFLWENTSPGEASDGESWIAALEAIHLELKDEFASTWQGLGDAGRRTLAAIAAHPREWLHKDVLASLSLARSTAQDARDRLLADGLLKEDEGGLRVIDPLLAMWVRNGREGLVADEV